MMGMTQIVSFAPPVRRTSTVFMAISIDTIEMRDMPQAVFRAGVNSIWRDKITVSRVIEVNMPFTTANVMINMVGHGILVIWKKNIVPKSPIEHPIKHQTVLYDARFQFGRFLH